MNILLVQKELKIQDKLLDKSVKKAQLPKLENLKMVYKSATLIQKRVIINRVFKSKLRYEGGTIEHLICFQFSSIKH